MLKILFLLTSIVSVTSNQCSCLLGYRNGSQDGDANLCMGPSEGGKRPCYPTPCNANWTACNTQIESNELIAERTKEKSNKTTDSNSVIDAIVKNIENLSIREIVFIVIIIVIMCVILIETYYFKKLYKRKLEIKKQLIFSRKNNRCELSNYNHSKKKYNMKQTV